MSGPQIIHTGNSVGNRDLVINNIAQTLLSIRRTHPLRVGIDGVDASGKTSLANELAVVMQKSNREIVRASIDHFHQPRAIRYRLGHESPEGYYRDSFDLPALHSYLLDPLGPSGKCQIITEQFDITNDVPSQFDPFIVSSDAILLFDGIFLHRPELLDSWDFSIFIQVSFDTVLTRAIQRDRQIIGSAEEVTLRYLTRYIPAQKSYLALCRPQEKANIVLVNNNLAQPELIVKSK